MIKVGLNGFGRIGRSIFRINLKKKYFDIVAINDVNPSNENLAYLLKYDSFYGRLKNDIAANKEKIIIDDNEVVVYHHESIADVLWEEQNIDIIIDASGINQNLKEAKKLKVRGIKNCIVTHSPDEVDFTIIMGVNEDKLDIQENFLISSSICDANAFSPVMHVLNEHYIVEHGFLTTLHPWLGYQNILDGPSRSFAYPGEIYENFALGRASTEALILKTTSCIKASKKVIPFINDNFQSLSYRVPIPLVSSADISVKLSKRVTKEEIISLFKKKEQEQKIKIFYNNFESLISKDFIGSDYSAIIDHRWTDVNKFNYAKLILWYDNEWGYSSRVVDIVNFINNFWDR